MGIAGGASHRRYQRAKEMAPAIADEMARTAYPMAFLVAVQARQFAKRVLGSFILFAELRTPGRDFTTAWEANVSSMTVDDSTVRMTA
jgi:hypothetical protein